VSLDPDDRRRRGELVASTIRRERPAYERGLGFLGTLGSNAPFLGLFGTMVGIIKAFADLGIGTAKGAGTSAMMAGLSGVIAAMAVGIFVAIVGARREPLKSELADAGGHGWS
jgi:biopolymer transport protein ExbB